MKKNTVVLTCLAVLFAAVSSCTTREDEPPPVSQAPVPDAQGFYSASSAGVTLKWKTDGTDPLLLECKLSAAATGWVAAGFNGSSTMDGANFIIGYVTGGSTAFISDEYGVGYLHYPDTGNSGTDNVTSAAGTEGGGTTEIIFKIPYNSGDAHDKILTKGGSVWLLLARGPDGSDNFTTKHSAFGAAQIVLY